MTRLSSLSLVAAAISALPAAAVGEEQSFRACFTVADDVERLRCYDRAAQSRGWGTQAGAKPAPAREPTSAAAGPPAGSPPQQDARSEAVERFGLEEQESKDEVDRISARLAAIDVRRNGERVFVLENGQVWRETSSTPSLRLEVGETVSIRSGLFGSHKLFGSGKVSARVERIR